MTNPPTTVSSTPRRALRLAGNLALAAVLLVSVAFLVPSLFGYERYVITGGSMSGTFERGSVAFEKTVPVSDLEVGDVITYLPPADSGVPNLVTHRIATMKVNRDGALVFRTKGDANTDIDPWRFQLAAGDQPKVEFTVPAIGYVFIGLADRSLRILVIGLPAALVALYSLVELLRAVRPRRADAPGAVVPISVGAVPQQRAPVPSPIDLVRTAGV